MDYRPVFNLLFFPKKSYLYQILQSWLSFSCASVAKHFLWNKLQKWNNKKGWKSVTLQCVSGAKYKKNGVRQLRRIQIPWRMLTNMWFFMYIHVQYSFSIDEIRMCTMNFELVHVLFRIISSMEKDDFVLCFRINFWKRLQFLIRFWNCYTDRLFRYGNFLFPVKTIYYPWIFFVFTDGQCKYRIIKRYLVKIFALLRVLC